MKRRTYIVPTVVVGVALGIAFAWRSARRHRPAPAKESFVANAVRRAESLPRAELASAPAARGQLSPEEKAAAIERIKRDYDEIRAKAAADYAAAGPAFPGGLRGFLAQLALLERERRADYLKILTPAELEELEMRESHAGETVRTLLSDTAATAEQRRRVFELQRDFDDQYGLTFDLSPAFLLARERDRQAMQEQVRGVLGDALFASWLRGEGKDFDIWTSFAAQRGLSAEVPLALWRLRNQFLVGRLELNANPALGPDEIRDAQAGLSRQVEVVARGILGAAATDPAAGDVLSWIPKP